MGGGLLQLVAYGAQDVYLTGNPQITFFKVVYRRHTNFALESIQQTFNGSVNFGNRVTATISRNGDLINRAYLVLSSTQTCDVPYAGLKVIRECELEIGGQKIDKHYGEWMYIWNELSLPKGKRDGYDKMVGGSGMTANTKYYVPLEFWFCRNVGLALPLIGLQYHEVKINIQFEAQSNMEAAETNAMLSAELWVDYVYLDTDERRKFAQSSHEYLIEQLQFTGKESASSKIKLNFNHPVKELVWVCHNRNYSKAWINYTSKSTNTLDGSDALVAETNAADVITNVSDAAAKNLSKTAKLTLNGNDRFAQRDGKYFNLVQPYQHHENVPSNKGINVYSFALKPEEHQPSGTLNMSRIDTATLDLTYEDEVVGVKSDNTTARTDATTFESPKVSQVSIYAVNYNVLRILSGMGGIAYSN
jgi:hypothetical protein